MKWKLIDWNKRNGGMTKNKRKKYKIYNSLFQNIFISYKNFFKKLRNTSFSYVDMKKSNITSKKNLHWLVVDIISICSVVFICTTWNKNKRRTATNKHFFQNKIYFFEEAFYWRFSWGLVFIKNNKTKTRNCFGWYHFSFNKTVNGSINRITTITWNFKFITLCFDRKIRKIVRLLVVQSSKSLLSQVLCALYLVCWRWRKQTKITRIALLGRIINFKLF